MVLTFLSRATGTRLVRLLNDGQLIEEVSPILRDALDCLNRLLRNGKVGQPALRALLHVVHFGDFDV